MKRGNVIMTQFTFDQAHSDIQFQIKHLMVSKVKGTFSQYDVQLDGDINDLSSLKATATIIPKTRKMKIEIIT